jgi:cell division protein FtsN
MKNKWAKIMASLALLSIIMSVIWTWLIILFSWTWNNQVELTQEQIQEIQELINSQSWTTSTWELVWTWKTINIEDIIEINE